MDQNTDATIYDQRGELEIEGRNFKRAFVCYSRAIRLDKNHILSLGGMCFALVEQKKYKEALLPFKKVVMRNPNDASAYYNLGIVLDKLGKIDEGIEIYKEVIRLDPTNPEGHFNLATLLMTRERYEEARKYYLKVEELRPSDAFLVSNAIGCLYFNQGMFSKAIEKFQESISLYKKYPLPYWNMSLVLFCENRSEEALKYFEDGMKTLEDKENKIETIQRIIESYVDLKTRFEAKLSNNNQIFHEEQMTLFRNMIAGLIKMINLLSQQLSK